MYLYLIFGVITCSVGWLYLRWLKIKRYWADRDVPHLPPVPILGSLTFLWKENIGLWLRRINEHFKSPYIGFWLFWKPALIINSPDIVRNILVKDFNNFRNRHVSSGVTDPIGGLNLFTVKDPTWSTMRGHLSNVFSPAKLRTLQHFTRTKTKELVQRIHNDRNIKICLQEMFVDYTTDVIGTFTFGVKSDMILTGVGPLRELINDFSKYNMYRTISWYSIFFIPELVDVFRFKFFPEASTVYFKKIFRVAASQRETSHKNGEAKHLLDVLLKIQSDNESYSDDLIISQAAMFFFAGYEATGASLAYMTYELAYYPEIQDKLYQELSEAADRNGSEDFDIEVLAKLTYLNAVIKEGLRKYITLTWLDRVTAEDYKIDDKLTIEASTVVYINIFGMHYDPEYFPEPYKFNPERFLPENKNKIEPYTYLAFGDGPKTCIGKRFGLMMIQFALASVILNYKLRPCPNMPHPLDIKISNRGLLFLPGEELNIEFVPRK